ncbi:hypothetical protein [Micromonospora sp. ATA51]|uniref:hypothetical protein n=1 Tax=Micromonospora sp. ATA51 TaxID=2806098 RepID=UPI001A581859|nr:hypothetical protein [Micromonospora sp. ATA51]MBM0227994.1 hypothetical protein [Micromonospora sp. ATA51]
MRYGGGTSARLRRRLLAAAVLAALAATGVLVAVPLLRDRSQHRLDRRADREVTATAQRTRAALLAVPSASGPALRDAPTRRRGGGAGGGGRRSGRPAGLPGPDGEDRRLGLRLAAGERRGVFRPGGAGRRHTGADGATACPD